MLIKSRPRARRLPFRQKFTNNKEEAVVLLTRVEEAVVRVVLGAVEVARDAVVEELVNKDRTMN